MDVADIAGVYCKITRRKIELIIMLDHGSVTGRGMNYRNFCAQVGSRVIFNRSLGKTVNKVELYMMYRNNKAALRKILDDDHVVYGLRASPATGRPPSRTPAAEVRRKVPEKPVARKKFVAPVSVKKYPPLGVVLVDKYLDPVGGSYQVDGDKEREWRRKKQEYKKLVY